MENQQSFELKETQLSEKRKKWNSKMAQMLKPDVYDYVFDEKIRDTVVALNLLGINTTQSDQGNYSNSPWIQFQASEPQDYYISESELRSKVLEEKNLQPDVMEEESASFNRSTQVDILADSRDKLMESGSEYTPEFLGYLEDTKKMVENLQNYIDEYYANGKNLQDEEIKVVITYPYDDNKYATYFSAG